MKISSKAYSIIGLVLPIWFFVVYVIMSSLRPEFSFLTKAISELGSVDALNKWWWNILGYFVPGIAIAVFSFGLYRNISPHKTNKWPLIGMAGSGLFMALSGIFPGDMDNRQSFTMIMHLVGSMGSYFFFLVGAFTFAKQMKASSHWKASSKITLVITWCTILLGSLSYLLPQTPGVGQRLVFLFYFMWIFYTAWKMFRSVTVN
jgi:hypothetical membrane protein